MTNVEFFAGILAVVWIAYFVTGIVRSYSLKYSIVDRPNERSSHTTPTPRGGGLAIAICTLIGILCLTYSGHLSDSIGIALLGGGGLVSLIGWVDDHIDIPAMWRGLSYFIAALWGCYYLGAGNLFGLDMSSSVPVIVIVYSIFTLGITWLVNLYNFMDGSDGLAATQAICTSLAGAYIFITGNEFGLGIVCLLIASSCAGFLFWNWAPAKIFMGDVSSCLLGFVFGVLMIAGIVTGTTTLFVWFILLSLFIWDSTFTLIKRIISGEKWYMAHRTHAYQKLLQNGMSHSSLALYTLAINICILWPLSFCAYHWPDLAIYLFVFSVGFSYLLWGSILHISNGRRNIS